MAIQETKQQFSKCGTCKWAAFESAFLPEGFCHGSPPQAIVTGMKENGVILKTIYPRVSRDAEGCKEHEVKLVLSTLAG